VSSFNLILSYHSGFMGAKDLRKIETIINERAPDISVFITPSNSSSIRTAKRAASRPTLIVSLSPLEGFKPRRGKVHSGQAISKIEQMNLLGEAGVPIPDWKFIRRGTKFDQEEWGESLILKPTSSLAAQGRGIQLVKTENVEFIPPEKFPASHVAQGWRLIGQRFIDSGQYPSEYRVLCFFGKPLYAIRRQSSEIRPPASDIYDLEDPRDLGSYTKLKKFGFSDATGETHYTFDEDALALASQVYNAFPQAPLHGVDLVREEKTGKLFLLEINPRGLTWHFSSSNAKRFPLIDGMKREDQFDAFSVVANELIDRTRTEAE
jgi:hypothetical protein